MWQTHELAIKIVAKKNQHATTVRKQPNFVIPTSARAIGRRRCDIKLLQYYNMILSSIDNTYYFFGGSTIA